MSIGENLKYFREKAGLTQGKLALEIGITQVMITHYERDLKTPRLEIFIRIAEYLGITPNDLIYGEESKISQKSNTA